MDTNTVASCINQINEFIGEYENAARSDLRYSFIQHPTTMILAGPTGSGKSTYVRNLLKNQLIQPEPKHIVLFYGCMQEIYESMLDEGLVHETHKGLHDLDEVYRNVEKSTGTLFIIDDLMLDATRSKTMCDLVIRGSHHDNLTLIIVYHNLLPQERYSRTIAMNAQYMVVFYNFKTPKQFERVVRERRGSKTLISMYYAMEDDSHPKPLVIDNRNNKAWYGLHPVQVIDLTGRP
jgi:ABC-type Mn2+/Zn2+ transport system ATPase subunit